MLSQQFTNKIYTLNTIMSSCKRTTIIVVQSKSIYNDGFISIDYSLKSQPIQKKVNIKYFWYFMVFGGYNWFWSSIQVEQLKQMIQTCFYRFRLQFAVWISCLRTATGQVRVASGTKYTSLPSELIQVPTGAIRVHSSRVERITSLSCGSHLSPAGPQVTQRV